jgi:hypothetical protein
MYGLIRHPKIYGSGRIMDYADINYRIESKVK